MGRLYVTGDRHGKYTDLADFCNEMNTTIDDKLIILGDHGLNYYDELKVRDRDVSKLADYPITIYCIKGNHDQRAEEIEYWKRSDLYSKEIIAAAYRSLKAPNVYFAETFGPLDIFGHPSYQMGGAYSVDKYYRLEKNWLGNKAYKWFADEQLTDEELTQAFDELKELDKPIIFSHTGPYTFQPVDTFKLPVADCQIETRMEEYFDVLMRNIDYSHWLCGHWHINRSYNRKFGPLDTLYTRYLEITPDLKIHYAYGPQTDD